MGSAVVCPSTYFNQQQQNITHTRIQHNFMRTKVIITCSRESLVLGYTVKPSKTKRIKNILTLENIGGLSRRMVIL